MKCIYFIACDPGGYDVIRPIYDMMITQPEIRCSLGLSGASGSAHPEFQVDPDVFLAQMDELDPSEDTYALVTGTSWKSTFETDAIRLCRSKGIVTISVLDFWSNYRMRFLNGEDFVFPDYFFVMDDLAAREALEDGVDSDIRTIGHPGLDSLYGVRARSTGGGSDAERRVLLLSQPIRPVYGDTLGFDEYEVTADVVRVCLEQGVDLSILFHPKDEETLINQYAEYAISGKIKEIVCDYDIVISMITIGLLHCVLLGIPVLSYQPHPSDMDLCVTDRLGITHRLTSYDELTHALTADMSSGVNVPLPEWFDGRSAKRGVDEILQVMDEYYRR